MQLRMTLFVLLNLVDLWCILLLTNTGVVDAELNPLAQLILQQGRLYLVLFKLANTLVLCWVNLKIYRLRPACGQWVACYNLVVMSLAVAYSMWVIYCY